MLRKILLLFALLGLLLVGFWPAIFNGYPFFHGDTPSYFRYVDVAVARVTGRSSDWAPSIPLASPGSALAVPETAAGDHTAKTPFAGRSIYYGALLELGEVAGTIWLSVALQAAAFMLTIALILHHTVGFNGPTFAGSVIALSLATPVAFFSSYLMPDLFAGVTILCVAALLIYGNSMTRGVLLAWVGLLCAGLLFHSSHVLIAMVLLSVCLIGRFLFQAPVSSKGLISVAFGLAVAFGGDAVFTIASSRMFGVTPIRPPFLMARLIADGPGEAFLRDRCPQAGFAVCRFVDRLPISTAHVFLWSADPKTGVLAPADSATKRALADEQFRFAYSVLRYDPIGVAAAALRNTFVQSVTFSLDEFNLNNDDRYNLRRSVPSRHLQMIEKTKGWADTLPVGVNRYALILTAPSLDQGIIQQTQGLSDLFPAEPLPAVFLIVLLISILYTARIFLPRDHRSSRDRDMRNLVLITIFGVLVNAFVCGALSEPYERYQARVIWLIPLLAMLIYLMRRRRDAVPVPSAQPVTPQSP